MPDIDAASNIQILGIKSTVAALRAFEPEVAKALNKSIKRILEQTEKDAISKIGYDGYKVQVTQRRLLGSITTTPGTRNDNKWGASDPGVKASIFEYIGSKYSGTRPQVLGLIASLDRRAGRSVKDGGRFLWQAWDETKGYVLPAIKEEVDKAERILQDRLDAAGESY